MSATVRDYYQLAKPGIIYGNLLPAVAGFLLASRGHIDLVGLITMLIGLGAVIGAACVYNNYLDRGIDRQMSRTKRRPLVTGLITGPQALCYATLLLLVGTAVLTQYSTPLAVGLALFGLVAYVALYGFGKRRTVYGTLIGSISGAIPPVVGYTAVTGRFDLAALVLFLILVCWQMPHFYAIALFRADDYKAAGLPVLPVARGARIAKLQVMIYVIAFTVSTSLLSVYGYTGIVYAGLMIWLGVSWFGLGLLRYNRLTDAVWGRQMFGMSLLVMCGWSALTAVSVWL